MATTSKRYSSLGLPCRSSQTDATRAISRCLRRLTDSTAVPQLLERRAFTSTKATVFPFRIDQIEVVAAQLEAVRLHRPAAGGEERNGDLLAAEAEELALVFPFGGWNEAAGARHATR